MKFKKLDKFYVQIGPTFARPVTIIHIETEISRFEDQKYLFTKNIKLYNPYQELVNINPDVVDVHFDIQKIVERVVYEIEVKIKAGVYKAGDRIPSIRRLHERRPMRP